MEDTKYPVGLRQQRRVDEGEAKASADSLHRAHHRARLGEEHEGDEVADQEATQQEVAQLTSRCLQDTTHNQRRSIGWYCSAKPGKWNTKKG